MSHIYSSLLILILISGYKRAFIQTVRISFIQHYKEFWLRTPVSLMLSLTFYCPCRRHYLEFPPGVLDKHYEKLLQRESRFFAMSKRSFPIEESPYFNFSFGFNGNGHEMNYAMELLPYPCLPKHFGPAHLPHQMHEPTNQPPISMYSSNSPISGT